jgi:nitrogen fixation/metabolism regulation signal transduction histidine kinase
VPQHPHYHRKPKRQSISFEARLRVFCTVGALCLLGLSAIVLALLHVTMGPMLATLGILLLILLLVFAAFIEEAIRPIQTLANVVAALREEDYSFRARGANREDSVGQLSLEINALADTLQSQRVGALEAVALLRRVIAEMDAPVLAFDQETRLRLLNPAAERVFSLLPARDLAKTATDLELTSLLNEPSEAAVQLELPRATSTGSRRSEPTQPQRWMIRRSTFRQRGVPHTLVVLSDVSAALREEERLAWRRLIRVIGHEISNSLTPIKSIAGSLRSRILPKSPNGSEPATTATANSAANSATTSHANPTTAPPASPQSPAAGVLQRDLQRGLSVIENRAESLNRFVQAYRQLAQLPAPVLKRVPLVPLLERVVSLEIRLEVHILAAPDVDLLADQDQIEQLLINLVRNAVESALTCAEEEPEPVPRVILNEAKRSEGSAFPASIPTNPAGNENSVTLSEASESVAPAPGRNNQSERESNGPAFPVPSPTDSVMLSEASESVAPAFGRNKQSERESNEPALSEGPARDRSRTGPAFAAAGRLTPPCAPEVTLRATDDADLVTIAIEDNGPGLANPENLFVPLYTTKKAGSGVGLALARQIVEAHGGTIELRNKPNHTGCIAEVRIPIAERA